MHKKYGVLGAAGFLGHHIMDYLSKTGTDAIGVSRRTGVDARTADPVVHWIADNGITHVINLAAECGGIGLNKKHPARLWLTTMEITSAVLEAARRSAVDKLCMVGTVCSYARDCPVPFKEEDLMHHGEPEPTNAGYGVAKLTGLFGCRAYRKEFNLNAIFLLPVNLYGPHDNFHPDSSHVIPALIKKCVDARDSGAASIICWGTGSATREFLYAGDAAEAIVLATEKYNSDEPVNIGAGREISIKDLVELIAKLTKFTGKIVWDPAYPDGQPRRCLNVDRAKQFGFQAKTKFEDGLASTIEWYERTRR